MRNVATLPIYSESELLVIASCLAFMAHTRNEDADGSAVSYNQIEDVLKENPNALKTISDRLLTLSKATPPLPLV